MSGSRLAKCCDCGKTVPSDQVQGDETFTACGPGSTWSELVCAVCGEHISGHDSRVSTHDHRFTPGRVEEFDDFACGCGGPQ